MVEETEETTRGADSPHPPPPPPTDPPKPRRELRRSRDDKVIAGVATGIGRYFDIDPVIVRIAFVVLTIVGGSGVLLYLVAWLVIAQEGEADSAAGRALRATESRGRGVAAVLLVVAALLILGGPVLWLTDFGVGDGMFFPLLLVAAGVALLLWPDEEARDRRAERRTPPAQAPPAAPAASESADAAETAGYATEPVPAGAGAPPTSTALVPASGVAVAEPPLPPPPTDRAHPADGDGPPLEGETRRSFPIGSITVALLLVATGIGVLLDRADAIDLQPARLLATWLLIIGLGLIVSAFVGRSLGLVILGLVILPFLWFVTAIDIEWWSGAGDERVIVTEVDELDSEYRHGMGRLEVDLSRLDLGAEDVDEVEVAVGLSLGELVVVVPDDTEVVVDFAGEIGEINVEGPGRDLRDDGFGLDLETTLPGSNGRILLDLDLGIGEGRVEVAR